MNRNPIVTIVLVLLAIWILLAVIGIVIKGLFWLFIIAVVFLVLTALFGGRMRNRR